MANVILYFSPLVYISELVAINDFAKICLGEKKLLLIKFITITNIINVICVN